MVYKNTWTWKASTTFGRKEYLSAPLASEVKQHFIDDGQLSKALGAFVQKLVDGGFSPKLISYYVDAYVTFLYRTPGSALIGIGTESYRTNIILTVVFETAKNPQLSPLAPLVIIAIGVAIAIIIGGVGVYYALQNLTTTSSVIVTETYDESGRLVTRRTETITKPPTEAIPAISNTIIIIAIVLIFAVLMFPLLLGGIKKK